MKALVKQSTRYELWCFKYFTYTAAPAERDLVATKIAVYLSVGYVHYLRGNTT